METFLYLDEYPPKKLFKSYYVVWKPAIRAAFRSAAIRV